MIYLFFFFAFSISFVAFEIMKKIGENIFYENK